MKRIIFIPVFLLLFNVVWAIPTLSPDSRISVLTIGPGEELYSCFGHNAILVEDKVNGIEKVYNYGTFDFDEPGFYVKFTKGQLDYMLSTSSLDRMIRNSSYENRSVIAQELNLTGEEKQALFDFLEWNYLPENRYYRYDFFMDNCATRVRDAIANVLGKRLTFGEPVDFDPANSLSFRQLIDLYLQEKVVEDFGMDIGLGSPADKKATAWDYMFLPEFLLESIAGAKVKDGQDSRPLVAQTKYLYEAEAKIVHQGYIGLNGSLWVVFAVVAAYTLFSWKNKVHSTYLDSLLFFAIGLVGLLLVFLWFGTDHKVTAYNWDLLWAWPLHLVAAVMLRMKKAQPWLGYYFLAFGLVASGILVFWPFIPQELNMLIIPVILMLVVRSFFLSRTLVQKRIGSMKHPVH